MPSSSANRKFVEQKPFLLDTTCNIKTDKEDNINVESIRFVQETSGTRATILVIDKNILLVTELEDDIEKSFEAVAVFRRIRLTCLGFSLHIYI